MVELQTWPLSLNSETPLSSFNRVATLTPSRLHELPTHLVLASLYIQTRAFSDEERIYVPPFYSYTDTAVTLWIRHGESANDNEPEK